MGLLCRTDGWTLVLYVGLLLVSAGCSDAVRLMRDTDTGGVVTYLYKDDRGGPMGSPHRKEALRVMEKKCPSGYTVLRDGEVAGHASLSSIDGPDGESLSRRWGIQFRCK